MKIRSQLLIGFLTLILIFAVDFFVNQKLSKQVLQNTAYISNSETVIRNSNMLHKEMIEMQSSFRGFLLTGQEVFLKPYYEGTISVPALMKEQKSLVSTLEQKEKLDSINMLHEKWLDYAKSLITYKLDTLPEANKKYQELFETKLRMEVGKKLNDRIQVIFTVFDNYEYQLRQERRDRLQESIGRTRSITLGLTVISILLALLLSFYFIRAIGNRISEMVSLANEISKGNFKTIIDTKRDELNELSLSLNSMSNTLEKNFRELRKKNVELDQFAYVVSHDLKAPLRGISNIIAWLEEDHANEITPEVYKNLELIKGRSLRLENMINGLLEYARVGRVKKGFEKVNVDLMVKDIIKYLVPKNFRVKFTGNLPVISTEKLRIEQVFSNLISNAVKYNSTEAPEIEIISEELAEYYRFTVKDNGFGIEERYFDKIFVIFQTLKERDAFESTGVGLAIVKKIVEDYKGTINVQSKMGEGTGFVFTWPK
jgi:signal transduction histidine kinase